MVQLSCTMILSRANSLLCPVGFIAREQYHSYLTFSQGQQDFSTVLHLQISLFIQCLPFKRLFSLQHRHVLALTEQKSVCLIPDHCTKPNNTAGLRGAVASPSVSLPSISTHFEMVNIINSFAEHPDEKEALSGPLVDYFFFLKKHCYTITNQIFQNKVIFFECLITLRFLRAGHVAPFAVRPTSQVFPFREQHIMSYSGMILTLLVFFSSLKLTDLEKAPFLSTLPQTYPPFYHPIVFVLLSNSKNYFLHFKIYLLYSFV